MPSRVRPIDFTALVAAGALQQGKDYVLVAEGRRLEQVGVVTLPVGAAGLAGIKIGAEGDAVRLNAQGQVFNLTGEDSRAGVWLVWMGNGVSNPAGVAEFLMAFAPGEAP